jgi:hypothetical protein
MTKKKENASDGSTPFSRWKNRQPHGGGVAPIPATTSTMVEYACMSHDHASVPYYYQRRRGTGSVCDCGRSN